MPRKLKSYPVKRMVENLSRAERLALTRKMKEDQNNAEQRSIGYQQGVKDTNARAHAQVADVRRNLDNTIRQHDSRQMQMIEHFAFAIYNLAIEHTPLKRASDENKTWRFDVKDQDDA